MTTLIFGAVLSPEYLKPALLDAALATRSRRLKPTLSVLDSEIPEHLRPAFELAKELMASSKDSNEGDDAGSYRRSRAAGMTSPGASGASATSPSLPSSPSSPFGDPIWAAVCPSSNCASCQPGCNSCRSRACTHPGMLVYERRSANAGLLQRVTIAARLTRLST
jgi:hypothetical protein